MLKYYLTCSTVFLVCISVGSSAAWSQWVCPSWYDSYCLVLHSVQLSDQNFELISCWTRFVLFINIRDNHFTI